MKLSSLTQPLAKFANSLYQHRVTLFLIGFVACYGFLVTRITAYTQREPTAQVSEQAIKRLTIDEESIEKLEDLEDQNIEVRSLFEDARKNPFSE